jgi:hypothetical protein
MSGLRYPRDEIARRGEALFESEVLPSLNVQDRNDIVAIDIESGAYVIDTDQLAAADRLLAQNPDAQIWFRRVGSRYVDRMLGMRYLRERGLNGLDHCLESSPVEAESRSFGRAQAID